MDFPSDSFIIISRKDFFIFFYSGMSPIQAVGTRGEDIYMLARSGVESCTEDLSEII
jgi:hypothetical protein